MAPSPKRPSVELDIDLPPPKRRSGGGSDPAPPMGDEGPGDVRGEQAAKRVARALGLDVAAIDLAALSAALKGHYQACKDAEDDDMGDEAEAFGDTEGPSSAPLELGY
jgi:hypothetical protein